MKERQFKPELAPALEAMLPEDVWKGQAFGHPAYYVGKKMCACLMGPGVGLKLPRKRADELIVGGEVMPFEAYGKAMGGWIIVSDAAAHPDLVEEAVEYVRTIN